MEPEIREVGPPLISSNCFHTSIYQIVSIAAFKKNFEAASKLARKTMPSLIPWRAVMIPGAPEQTPWKPGGCAVSPVHSRPEGPHPKEAFSVDPLRALGAGGVRSSEDPSSLYI